VRVRGVEGGGRRAERGNEVRIMQVVEECENDPLFVLDAIL
jgi:hypothetical protein